MAINLRCKMKNSIVKKVFLSIMTIMLLTLGIQLIFQMFFATDVYIFFRQAEVKDELELVIDDYGKDYDLMTKDLYESTYMPMLVIDKDGNLYNETFFEQLNYLTLETKEGSYKVVVGDRVNEAGILEDGNHYLIEGNHVNFTGALLKNSNVLFLDANISNPLFEAFKSVEGEISSTHYIVKEEGVLNYQAEKLIREVGYLLRDNELQEDDIEFIETETGLIINMFVRQVEDYYIVALYTIEDLSNTISVLNRFNWYFFVFQVIMLIGVSFVYTRWFTRPLQRLNDEAKLIANLDFDHKSEVKSGDELEELSNSLNSIAENMKDNIELLKADAKEKSESEAKMRELLANLSHEFKTPLGIMSGFMEMLEVDEENKEYYIKTIQDEIDKLNGLTKETLLLCESENYHERLSLNQINLEELCNVSKFTKRMDESEMSLLLDVLDVQVLCDEKKIQTVMDNLMSNAIKYSNRGASISIYTGEDTTSDNNIRIHVKNTGVTIPEDEIDKIWSKYYRVEKSRNKDFGGNGIGLAITKNILDAHESTYGVYNEEDAVVFFFELNKA